MTGRDLFEQSIATAIRLMAPSAPFLALAWIFIGATSARCIMRYDVYVLSIAGPLMLLTCGLVIGLFGLGLVRHRLGAAGHGGGHLPPGRLLLQSLPFLGALFDQHASRPLLEADDPVLHAGDARHLLYSLQTQIDVLMLPFFRELKSSRSLRHRQRHAEGGAAFDPMFSAIVSEPSFRRRHDDLDYRFFVISRWILTVNLPLLAACSSWGNRS